MMADYSFLIFDTMNAQPYLTVLELPLHSVIEQ